MYFIEFAFNSLCCGKPFIFKEIFFTEWECVTREKEVKIAGKSHPALFLVLLASPS